MYVMALFDILASQSCGLICQRKEWPINDILYTVNKEHHITTFHMRSQSHKFTILPKTSF